MPQSKLQVVSMALQMLGQKPIAALNNSSDIEISASNTFDLLLPGIIQRNSWRFATKIDYLWIASQNPILSYWKYIFDLPTDFLETIRLYPQSYSWEIYENSKIYANFGGPTISMNSTLITGFNAPGDYLTAVAHGLPIGVPTIVQFSTTNTLPATNPTQIVISTFYYAVATTANRFQVFTSYANAVAGAFLQITSAGIGASVQPYQNNTYIEYVKLPNTAELPDIFANYFVYEIAAFLCLSNAQYSQFAQYIDGKLAEQRGIAMAWDAKNRPQQGIVSQPIITNRFVSGFLGGPTGGGAGASG